MATKYAQADGNWSTLQWYDAASGGNPVSTPTSGDTAEANGHTVAIDVTSLTCDTLQTLNGGTFTVDLASGANRTINAHIVGGTNDCITTSGATYSLTVNGNVTGGTASNTRGIYSATAYATFVINGNVTGGSASGALGINAASISPSITVTGNVSASLNSAAACPGYRGSVTVFGDIEASANCPAVMSYSSYYTVTIYGNLISASNGSWPISCNQDGVRILWRAGSADVISVRDLSLNEVELSTEAGGAAQVGPFENGAWR